MNEQGKNNQKKLVNKANTKYFSTRIALGLLDSNPKSSLGKAYRITTKCNEDLLYDDETQKLKSFYCKNRWCRTCNRIRTANLINGYLPILDEMKDPQFVTLTAPTVHKKRLKERIKSFEGTWRTIMGQVRNEKKSKNPLFSDFKGIRKMECTLRPQDYYHYHYHVVIDGKTQADWLIDQWLKRIPSAEMGGQDVRPADKKSLKELFKYFTKLTAKDEGLFQTKERYIGQFQRLDYLFRTLKGKRVYQAFGGVKKISEDIDEQLEQRIERPQGFEGKQWTWIGTTWESELKEILCDYVPSKATLQLLKYAPLQEGE